VTPPDRLHIDDDLMRELQALNEQLSPRSIIRRRREHRQEA